MLPGPLWTLGRHLGVATSNIGTRRTNLELDPHSCAAGGDHNAGATSTSSRLHGVDERVSVDGLEFDVRVLERFVHNC
jgi:hypothetical protein